EAGDRPPKKPAARAFPPRREGTSSGRAARSSEACPEAREEAPRATRHKQLRRRRPRGAAAGETSPSDERLRWSDEKTRFCRRSLEFDPSGRARLAQSPVVGWTASGARRGPRPCARGACGQSRAARRVCARAGGSAPEEVRRPRAPTDIGLTARRAKPLQEKGSRCSGGPLGYAVWDPRHGAAPARARPPPPGGWRRRPRGGGAREGV
ncbi:unnamed protein product, partial [Prorocentrum cordatum]